MIWHTSTAAAAAKESKIKCSSESFVEKCNYSFKIVAGESEGSSGEQRKNVWRELHKELHRWGWSSFSQGWGGRQRKLRIEKTAPTLVVRNFNFFLSLFFAQLQRYESSSTFLHFCWMIVIAPTGEEAKKSKLIFFHAFPCTWGFFTHFFHHSAHEKLFTKSFFLLIRKLVRGIHLKKLISLMFLTPHTDDVRTQDTSWIIFAPHKNWKLGENFPHSMERSNSFLQKS